MLITRETDYAIRLIRGIADGQLHPVKAVCEDQQIPWKFAYKILGKLKSAGLVKSVSGVRGGIRLVKNPKEFTLYDVVSAIDDNRYLNQCLTPGYNCEYVQEKCTDCQINQRLRILQAQLDQTLASVSMHNLMKPLTAREQKALNQADEYLERELKDGSVSAGSKELEAAASVLKDADRTGG